MIWVAVIKFWVSVFQCNIVLHRDMFQKLVEG
jgi:hypothetical protein